jgi:signal transduction histidine kinase
MFKLHSIRARLISTYLLLIILPLASLSWFMLQWLNQHYLTRLQNDMNVEASIITEAVAHDMLDGRTIEAKALLNNPPPPLRSQARVFLFDKSGILIAASDSAFAPVLGQSLAEPGLESALAGHVTQGSEISPTTNIRIVYVAQPVVGHGQVVGAVHLSYSLSDIEQAEFNGRAILIGAVLLVAAIASFVGLHLMRSITEPLAHLGAAAAEISNGHFEQRASENVPTEMAPLSKSFNQMAEALQKSEQIRQMTFANIAHDVRTPLGSIQAAIEALSAGAVDKPELRERLMSGIVEQTHYLGRLTHDLLRLATYEGGGLELHRNAVDIGELILQAVRDVDARAHLQAVTITADFPASLPKMWADSDRVLEILFNLLDNALTYTPPSGHIRVWAESDAIHGLIRAHVCDTGPGIPAETIPHLFQRYWRGNYRRINANVNMGLGLSIVREIVKAHGGAIAATNHAEGADFHFALPVYQAGHHSDAQALANHASVGQAEEKTVDV